VQSLAALLITAAVVCTVGGLITPWASPGMHAILSVTGPTVIQGHVTRFQRIMALVLIGCFTKIGPVPLHLWLPKHECAYSVSVVPAFLQPWSRSVSTCWRAFNPQPSVVG